MASEPTTPSTSTATEPDPEPTTPPATTDPSPVEATTAVETDWTADLVAAGAGQPWADQVTSAIETEPGRLEVSTTIVDPRGDDGSSEAQQAVAVCEAAVELLISEADSADVHVSVFEDDGTHFVLYGHPMVPEGACTEV